MKIHYLITSLEAGGAEFAIVDIAKSFRSFGHTVEVIALEERDMGAVPLLQKENIKFHILFPKRKNIIKILISLICFFYKKKTDVIMTSLNRATTVGQIIGLLLRKPVISWKNSNKINLTSKIIRPLSLFWIADSYFVYKELHEKLAIPYDRIISWPLYICRETNYSLHYWDGKSPLHIGSSGRLCDQKNYLSLLKALSLFIKRSPQFSHMIHLSIAGDGPERFELEELIKTLRLEENVSLLGFVDDVFPFLQTLHVYTQPSHYEGLCIATHEAMEIGLPIIATPVGELSLSVQNNVTGFLVEDNTSFSERFCASLEYIFNNPSCLKELGENAQKYVRTKFSEEKYRSNCKNTLDLFDSLTK